MRREGSLQIERLGLMLRRWAGGPGCLAVHLGIMLVAATVLTLVNVARTPEHLWFWRPLAWWGVLLAGHAAWVVGGVVRRPNPGAPRSVGAVAVPPSRPARSERVLHHLASVARVVRSAGGRAADRAAHAWSERGAASAGSTSTAAAAASEWTPEEAVTFASWSQATDTWGNARPPEEPRHGGHADGLYTGPLNPAGLRERPRRAAAALANRPSADGERAPYAAEEDISPPTGRFRPAAPTEAELTPPTRAADEPSDSVPAAIAALWTPSVRDRASEPTEETGARLQLVPPESPAPPADSHHPGDGAASHQTKHANGTANQDVVLSGPIPVDPKDPQWAWLEAAAAAWLARREADVEVPSPPTGTLAAPSAAGATPGAHD